MKFSLPALAFLIGAFSLASAQTVSFTKIPASFQLFPRDNSDSGTAVVSGTVTGSGYDSIVVDVKKAGQSYKRSKATLAYSGNTAPFSISVRLISELSEYTFNVYGNTQRVGGADSVVCGDVYAFNGQSNMEAGGGSAYDWQIPEWVRSTGYAGSQAVWKRASFDCCFGNWPYGSGNGPQGAGMVAANLGKLLATTYQTPVCVINGAYSGTVIEQHQRNNVNHADTTTLYGRVLRRAQVAGVVNDIHAFLYYQGEYHNSYTTYAGLFDNLYKAWKEDYPGLKKVYIEQVNAGCGYATNPEVRNIQRKFADTYSDITVMTACGIREFTGCHFGNGGYAQIAAWWQPVYGRDFYGASGSDVTSPRIKSASFTNSGHQSLDLTFDMPVAWPADTLGSKMKDHITLGGTAGLADSARIFGNTLRLYLSAASNATQVSYIPEASYAGPYLRSAKGVGALSFLNFPITPSTTVESGRLCNVSMDISVTPNPVTGRALIRTPSVGATGRSPLQRGVCDIRGRIVARMTDAVAGAGNEFVWDARALPAGIYVIKVRIGNRELSKQIAVVR